MAPVLDRPRRLGRCHCAVRLYRTLKPLAPLFGSCPVLRSRFSCPSRALSIDSTVTRAERQRTQMSSTTVGSGDPSIVPVVAEYGPTCKPRGRSSRGVFSRGKPPGNGDSESVTRVGTAVVADPVQRRLGRHRRLLERLVAALGRSPRGGDPGRSAVTGLPGFSTSSTCFERLGASSTESGRRRPWSARDAPWWRRVSALDNRPGPECRDVFGISVSATK